MYRDRTIYLVNMTGLKARPRSSFISFALIITTPYITLSKPFAFPLRSFGHYGSLLSATAEC